MPTEEQMKEMATTAFKPAKLRKRKKREEDLPPAPTKAGRSVLKTITEQLPVALEMREIRKLGQRLAQQEGEITNHENRATLVKADLKAQEAKIRAEISSLTMMINDGTQLRDVSVSLEADYDAGVVRYLRQDTGDEIRTRTLAEEERQVPMFKAEEEPGTDHDPREPDIALPSGVSKAAPEDPEP